MVRASSHFYYHDEMQPRSLIFKFSFSSSIATTCQVHLQPPTCNTCSYHTKYSYIKTTIHIYTLSKAIFTSTATLTDLMYVISSLIAIKLIFIFSFWVVSDKTTDSINASGANLSNLLTSNANEAFPAEI